MEPPPPLASVTLPIVRVGIFPEHIVSPVFEIPPAVNGGTTVISTVLFAVMSTALIRVIVTVVVPKEVNELVGTIKVRVPANVPDIPIDILVAVFAPLKE